MLAFGFLLTIKTSINIYLFLILFLFVPINKKTDFFSFSYLWKKIIITIARIVFLFFLLHPSNKNFSVSFPKQFLFKPRKTFNKSFAIDHRMAPLLLLRIASPMIVNCKCKAIYRPSLSGGAECAKDRLVRPLLLTPIKIFYRIRVLSPFF